MDGRRWTVAAVSAGGGEVGGGDVPDGVDASCACGRRRHACGAGVYGQSGSPPLSGVAGDGGGLPQPLEGAWRFGVRRRVAFLV